jgi:hypothetical protein
VTTIKTEQPAHSEELLTALEKTLRAHNLRLKPGQDLAQIADAITARGFKIGVQHGYLEAEQTTAGSTQPVHVNRLIEGLATQQPSRFFPRDPNGVTARDQLDTQGKIEYLKTHTLTEWEMLPATSPEESVVVLDKNRLTCSQYLSLDRTTRAQLAGQWGADAIGRIMARTK